MPNKNIDGDYRYGYQGEFAEKDPETGMEAFELRLWDSRIGRWLSPDPYGEFHTPYLGMANNPVIVTDPDGGCTNKSGRPCEFSVLGGGAIDFQGNTWTSTRDGDITLLNQGLEEILISFRHPYVIDKIFTFEDGDAGFKFTSWSKFGSNFKPRATGGGVSVYGEFISTARVDRKDGNYYLTVSNAGYTNNDPRNRYASKLGIKYSRDKTMRLATLSYDLLEEPLNANILPAKWFDLGQKVILLPKNPMEIIFIDVSVGVHQRLPTGGVSKSTLQIRNLQDYIVND